MRRLVALAALPAVVTLVAAGAAASSGGRRTRSRPAPPPLGTASSFFLTELDEKLHDDWHDAWRSLYPLHQAIAPEAT